MSDDPLDAMKARWNDIQEPWFPWLREEVDPLTEALGRLVTTLDVIGLEAFVPDPPRGPGRPPEDRRGLARAFVAKAMLGIPTTSRFDRTPRRRQVAAAYPRLGATLASALGSHVLSRLRGVRAWRSARQVARSADRALAGGRIIGVIARDATEIEAREKPAANEANDKKDDPPSDGAQPPRKRGRPRKDEQRPKPEPTRLERQTSQTVDQMLAELPTACDVGSKKNSKGYKETWVG